MASTLTVPLGEHSVPQGQWCLTFSKLQDDVLRVHGRGEGLR